MPRRERRRPVRHWLKGILAGVFTLLMVGPVAPQDRETPGPDTTGPDAAPADRSTATVAKPSRPPESIIGQDVVNARGQLLGTVRRVVGTQVIITVASPEGAADRDVALPWKYLSPAEADDGLQLQTKLTMEQLKALMPYRGSRIDSIADRPGR